MNARSVTLAAAMLLGGAFITESPDQLVRGMDAGKADDPAYRAAYRDCMRARMSKGR